MQEILNTASFAILHTNTVNNAQEGGDRSFQRPDVTGSRDELVMHNSLLYPGMTEPKV